MDDEELVKMVEESMQVYTEIGENCQKIADLCKENLSIIKDPIKVVVQGYKLPKNNDLIQMHFMILDNYMNALVEKYKDTEE